jgi:hypothetical protein
MLLAHAQALADSLTVDENTAAIAGGVSEGPLCIDNSQTRPGRISSVPVTKSFVLGLAAVEHLALTRGLAADTRDQIGGDVT